MNVLCLSNLYPNSFEKIRGGFVRSQVQNLARLGCSVKVIAPVPAVPFPLRFRKKWGGYALIPKQVDEGDVKVFHPRYLLLPHNMLFEFSGWFYCQGVKKLVLTLNREAPFDLIHAHTALPDGYAAMLISKILQKPFVVTVHGRDFQDTITRNSRCYSNVLKALNSAGAVVNVSRKLAGICRTYLGEDPKIKVIGNGIEPDVIYEGCSPLRETYGGRKVILSVGSLRKTKGHDLTLRAVKELKEKFYNIKLVIIGGGEEGKNLERLAMELGIKELVEFIPPLPNAKVMEYMSVCDLFVLPSWNEGFGVVYLEAMAHGKPVVGVRGQGISDVICHGENGLLAEAGDLGSLVGAMETLLKDENTARRLGAQARKTVLKNYTWDHNARLMMDIYSGLLNAEGAYV